MAQIKLKDEIKGKKTVSFIKKPALWGNKCDCCGLIFTMERYCNDRLNPAILNGKIKKLYGRILWNIKS